MPEQSPARPASRKALVILPRLSTAKTMSMVSDMNAERQNTIVHSSTDSTRTMTPARLKKIVELTIMMIPAT